MSKRDPHLGEALSALGDLGFPQAQLNDRSAVALLALLNLRPSVPWSYATSPLMGITPIMDWAREHYRIAYAPNTRETVRRQTMHQFCDAGLALYNPDEPGRPTNSPKAVYQVAPDALVLLRALGTSSWARALQDYRDGHESLVARYAAARVGKLVQVKIRNGQSLKLSPGEHSELIRRIIEEFAPRFAPGSEVVYVGDTGEKWGYFDRPQLERLGVAVDAHGKMPDVVLYYREKNWLLLAESVTSHGPVDGKRHRELAALFGTSSAGLVFVTAFPAREADLRHGPHGFWPRGRPISIVAHVGCQLWCPDG